jgi:hypothetical protein
MASVQPTQVPGIWTLSPGDAGYDDACRAALKACGIDPDGFGTYNSRASAIRKAKADCQANGITAGNLTPANAGTFCTANSESGHMAQNAIFQARGAREDDCGNIPPNPFGSPTAGSSFGYNCGRAPCVDHFGDSNTGGTCHGEVTMGVESSQGWRDRGAVRGERVPMSTPTRPGGPTMEDQVRASARVHVDANRQQRTAGHSDPAAVQNLSNAQQQNAQRLTAGDPQASALAAQSGTGPGSPAGASAPGPSQAVKDFAAECEVTKWKQMMAAMRAQAINDSPIGQAAQSQFGKPFTELNQAQQQQVINNMTPKPFGSPPPAPSPTAQPGVVTPPASGRTGNPPTEQHCRDYQGNYLAWQQANAHGPGGPSTSGPGPLPPWEGRAPKGAQPGTPPPAVVNSGTSGGFD